MMSENLRGIPCSVTIGCVLVSDGFRRRTCELIGFHCNPFFLSHCSNTSSTTWRPFYRHRYTNYVGMRIGSTCVNALAVSEGGARSLSNGVQMLKIDQESRLTSVSDQVVRKWVRLFADLLLQFRWEIK